MPGNVGRFIVNHVHPELVGDSSFAVSNAAQRVTASGLAGNDVVDIQVWVGPAAGQGDGAWADLLQAGAAVQMDAFNTQRVFAVIGTYRAVYAGSADVRAFVQEDIFELDKNVVYCFNQPYGSTSGGGGGGFTLTPADTATIHPIVTGTTSSGTISANVKISADAGNTTVAHADGIYTPATGGSGSIPFTAESATFAVATTSHAYGVTVDEGTVDATLPAATTAVGQQYYMIGTISGGAFFTITPNGTDTINGANTPFAVASLVGLVMYCDGISNWILIGGA